MPLDAAEIGRQIEKDLLSALAKNTGQSESQGNGGAGSESPAGADRSVSGNGQGVPDTTEIQGETGQGRRGLHRELDASRKTSNNGEKLDRETVVRLAEQDHLPITIKPDGSIIGFPSDLEKLRLLLQRWSESQEQSPARQEAADP